MNYRKATKTKLFVFYRIRFVTFASKTNKMNNLMAKQLPDAPQPVFEQIKRIDENGIEYWSARDLGKVLEYLEYR